MGAARGHRAFAVVVLAALLGVFGQQHETVRAQAAEASLTVKAPARIRGGLFFQGRVDILARERIRRPVIALGEGWTEEISSTRSSPRRRPRRRAPASSSSSTTRWRPATT